MFWTELFGGGETSRLSARGMAGGERGVHAAGAVGQHARENARLILTFYELVWLVRRARARLVRRARVLESRQMASGCRVYGSGFRGVGSELSGVGVGFWNSGWGVRVSGFGFRV